MSYLQCSPQQQTGSDNLQNVARDVGPLQRFKREDASDEADTPEDQSGDGDDLAPRLQAASAAARGDSHVGVGGQFLVVPKDLLE